MALGTADSHIDVLEDHGKPLRGIAAQIRQLQIAALIRGANAGVDSYGSHAPPRCKAMLDAADEKSSWFLPEFDLMRNGGRPGNLSRPGKSIGR
jgi:hypothetical protein